MYCTWNTHSVYSAAFSYGQDTKLQRGHQIPLVLAHILWNMVKRVVQDFLSVHLLMRLIHQNLLTLRDVGAASVLKLGTYEVFSHACNPKYIAKLLEVGGKKAMLMSRTCGDKF